ncbi:hypothetical protein [Kribbella deserti]|uniref:Uncharacterized protein n=1 Tax=Kribbella deserti TaxID=1926257 RepID=A0ABV6QSF4_9ACTN
MRGRNGPLIAVVAGVAVVAIALGATAGALRGPRAQTGGAGPLPPADAPTTSRPVELATLSREREAGITSVRGRLVSGGIGNPVRVPGKGEIIAAGRLWDLTLVVVANSATSSELLTLDAEGERVARIPKVDSLVTSADGQTAAYASGGRYAETYGAGGTVFFQRPGHTPTARLERPRVHDLAVLGVVGASVYFRSAPTAEAPTQLFRWDADKDEVAEVKKVVNPTSVSPDGSLAAGLAVFTDSGSCSAVTDLGEARQRWRTCQHQLYGFSPGNRLAVGGPPGSSPYGDEVATVLDVETGAVLRAWTGRSIRGMVAEDDDHVLLAWFDRAEQTARSAIVRCTVSTGECALAGPVATEPLLLGS